MEFCSPGAREAPGFSVEGQKDRPVRRPASRATVPSQVVSLLEFLATLSVPGRLVESLAGGWTGTPFCRQDADSTLSGRLNRPRGKTPGSGRKTWILRRRDNSLARAGGPTQIAPRPMWQEVEKRAARCRPSAVQVQR